MKISVRVLMLVLVAATCRAQVAPTPMLKADDLQADAVILRNAYEQLHPGLYRYNSKAEMDGKFAALNHQLDHDQSLQAAFLAFSEFAAKIRCGHTQANPFNQSKELTEALLKTPTRLPFYFDWVEGEMIVTRDFTPGNLLPRGTVVNEINGVATRAILARLLQVTRADGANDSKRVAQLAVNGDSNYETFDLYYSMYFPQRGADDTLLVRKPNAPKADRLAVRPLTFEQRITSIKQREEERQGGEAALFDWRYLPDGSAYLRMPTWALYNSKWGWKQWLHEHLEDAITRNAPAIILDIRGNEGGDDVGNEILPYLIGEPIALSSMRRLVRYRKVPDELAPYLDTWDKSFRDWGTSAVDLPEPWPTAPAGVKYLKLVRYDDGPEGDVIKPSGKRFPGRVFVLIDANNSSATFQFAQTIQSHHIGTLVGQPTGGSQRGINGGGFFFLRLPHSGIEMDLPLIGTFPPSAAPDMGVSPDLFVKQTATDIVMGVDAGLEAAIQAIRQTGSAKAGDPTRR